MVTYSGFVKTPADTAHASSWIPRLEIRLLEEAHYGGTLINTDPQYVDLPSTGAYSIDLIPSDRLRARSGKAALYQVTETWLDHGGAVRRWSDWGSFYLTSVGGPLTDHARVPSGTPAFYVVESESDLPASASKGALALVMSTGELKEMV